MAIIQDIPIDERPREKALKFGVEILSNRELLAIIIRSGYHKNSALHLADDILLKAKGISNLKRLNKEALMSIKGIKEVKAIEILAVFELANRMTYEDTQSVDVINNPDALVKWLNLKIGNEFQEMFVVVFLNTKNHVIDYEIVFKGTVDASIIHPREIFKLAVLKSASSIIVAHNHPTKVLTPSTNDIKITNMLNEVGKIMNIGLLDHLIVNNYSYYSFKQNGYIT